LQLIEGLNRTRRRTVGIYPEIKQPGWHHQEGRDLSRVVLPILRRYGYVTKKDKCWIQCFEVEEVRRIRNELGWEGNLLLLTGAGRKNPDGSEAEPWFTPAGLAELAKFADGIGPSLGAIVTGKSKTERKITDLVRKVHAATLVVHPYTLRADELPRWADSTDDAHQVLFTEAGIDGLFTDFPDLSVRWLSAHGQQ